MRYFVELDAPADEIDRALTNAPETWVPGLARLANGHGEQLLTEVGFGEHVRVGRTVEIAFGEPIRLVAKTILPIRWVAAGAPDLFPTLDADLEVAPLGPSRTQLAMTARYVPPLGAFGRAIDRALLHRVAEATLKDFLDRVAESLRGEVAGARAASD